MRNKVIKLSIFYLILFLVALVLFLVSLHKSWHIKIGYFVLTLKHIFLILLICTIAMYIIHLATTLFKPKKKNATAVVDTTKIKDFGVSRWMQNDLEDSHKTISEFHIHFNCSNKNCLRNKKRKR